MPFRRSGRGDIYYIQPTLPGYGSFKRLSTGVKSKDLAVRMEQLLFDLAERAILRPDWSDLLKAVDDKRVSLIELVRADSRGELHILLGRLSDPLLSEAITEYTAHKNPDRQMTMGLNALQSLVPKEARLSYIADGKRLTKLLHQREQQGLKRNSVRRRTMRAASDLLRFNYGKAERNRIFADVDFPAENDRRQVDLSPQQIQDLLSAALEVGGHQLYVIIRIALATSADRGVLVAGRTPNGKARGLRRKDVEIFVDTETGQYHGRLYLMHDEKATGRRRTVGISHSLCQELIPLLRDKAPEDTVFEIKYGDLDYPWQVARDRAGLDGLWFKDLRHVFFSGGQKAGIPLAVSSKGGGHKQISRTAEYADYNAVFTSEHAQRLEEALGITALEERGAGAEGQLPATA